MKAMTVDGVVYDREFILGLREVVIKVRDACLMDNEWNNAVLLSHVIAVLADYAEKVGDS